MPKRSDAASSSSSSSSSSFRENVKTLVSIRDIAHSHLHPQDGLSVLERPWRTYQAWVLQKHPEDIAQSIASLQISAKYPDLSKPFISQAFKYGSYVKPWADVDKTDETDTRLWDAFCNWSFPGPTLQCDFFRSDGGKDDRSELNWKAEKATVFEKVLFLFFIARLSNLKAESIAQSPPKKKKMRKEERPWKKSYRKDRRAAQRVGHVTQFIVRSWDVVAKVLKFTSVEDMLLPYILLSLQTGVLSHIAKRSAGYSPRIQSRRLPALCSSTTAAEDIAPGVQARDDIVDKLLRKLAAFFIHDLESNILVESLFSQQDGRWANAEMFAREERKVPKRFYDLDGILQALQSGLGVGEEGLHFRDREVSVGTAAASASQQVSQPPASVVPLATPLGDRTGTESNGDDSGNGAGRNGTGECQEGCPCEKAREEVEGYMQNFVRLHNCCFSELIDADGQSRPDTALDVEGNVQLVLMDPPFNIRRELGRRDSTYDSLHVDEMFDVAATVARLLRPGGHVFIMCSAVQFAQWVVCFRELTKENERGQMVPLFNVDEHDYVMVNAPGHYTNFAARRSTSFVSFHAKGFHAVRIGAGREEVNSMVRYSGFGFVPSRFPGYVNVIDNVERVQAGERLYFRSPKDDSRRRVRAEQKNTDLLRELICRLSKPGDYVVDLFGGTFSSSIAAMTIPSEQLRRFVGSEKDEGCFQEAEKWCVDEFSRVLLHSGTDPVIFPRPPGAGLVESARLVVSHLKAKGSAKSMWNAPPGLPSMSVLPPYLMDVLSELLHDIRLSRQFRDKEIDHWPTQLQAKFHNVDLMTLRAVDAMHSGVYLKASNIKHPRAGEGVFARKTFYANDTITNFYGTLIYRDLSTETAKTKQYGTGLFGITAAEFTRRAMTLPIPKNLQVQVSPSSSIAVSYVGVSPLPCSVGGMINDPRYLLEDRERFQTTNRRTANVRFHCGQDRLSEPKHFSATDAISIVATRTIRPDEELYVDYGSEFMFEDNVA